MRKSEEAFQRAIELDPTDVRGYVSLGTLYVRQNRLEAARRMFDEGCTVSEGRNPYVWTALANLERKAGNYSKAKKCYDAALVNSKTHAAAWHGWGMLEQQAGNYAAARDVFARGIQATAADPNPYLLEAIANLAAELELVDEARYWYRRGTNTPMGARSHAIFTSWALLEWRQGDPAVAPYLFQMALRQHPQNRYALLSYAMFEKDSGNVDACRLLLEHAIEVNPTDPALLQAYGRLFAEEGNYAKAREIFQRGVDIDPRHQPIWQVWAITEWLAGRVETARKLFQRGVWADPKSRDNVYLWQAWGIMEGKQQNCAVARMLFKAGLKADPENEPCWQAWLDMEEANGLFDSADQLRNYRMAARQRIAVPNNFSTLPAPTNSVMSTILKWVQIFDKSQTSAPPEAEALTPTPSSGDSFIAFGDLPGLDDVPLTRPDQPAPPPAEQPHNGRNGQQAASGSDKQRVVALSGATPSGDGDDSPASST